MLRSNLTLRNKALVMLALSLVLISIGIEINEPLNKEDYLKNNYINTRNIAPIKISTKKNSKKSSNNIFSGPNDLRKLSPVNIYSNNKKIEETLEEVSLTVTNFTEPTKEPPRNIWYLPTESGIITQNPRIGHVALDITSPRGTREVIFPIANGIISGIYKDKAGAKIVTILHDVAGKKYTSQYVHLSSYSKDIYVGRPVTINDPLGNMGTTGKSTGVHLHLALIDCALFDPNDHNCHSLSSFYKYANTRLKQGYIGLGAMIYVPGEWSSR